MNQQDAAQTYKHAAIENAPPIKIVRMLYAGAIRFIDQALALQEPGPDFTEAVFRADRIVTELRLALIKDHDPVLAENLESLYVFVEGRLARAGLERGKQPLREAKRILETLQDAWMRVDAKIANEG